MTGLNANTAATNDAGNCLMARLYWLIAGTLCAADRSLTNLLYAPIAQQIHAAKKLTQSVVLSMKICNRDQYERRNKNAPQPLSDMGRITSHQKLIF
jgi:hypothetical protein